MSYDASFVLVSFCLTGAPQLRACWYLFAFRWYKAEDHVAELEAYMAALDVEKTFSCLDFFGASRRIASTWIQNGFSAVSFDIKLSKLHDLCSATGVHKLATYGMQFPGLNVLTSLVQYIANCSIFL